MSDVTLSKEQSDQERWITGLENLAAAMQTHSKAIKTMAMAVEGLLSRVAKLERTMNHVCPDKSDDI